jgi:hypothetical protein
MPAPKGNQYAKGCETSGAPLKYTPEFIDELIAKVPEYLESCQDKYNELTKKVDVELPCIEGFMSYCDNYNKEKFYQLDKNHKEFSNALNKIRVAQLKKLQNNGLNNTYNPSIAKLLLSANHNKREKTEENVNLGGQPSNPVVVSFADIKDDE